MKRIFLVPLALILACALFTLPSTAQTGLYAASFEPSVVFRIRQTDGQWSVEIIGQGQAPLRSLGNNKFIVDAIKPPATLQFVPDGKGGFGSFTWAREQKPQAYDMKRLPGKEDPTQYPGRYNMDNQTFLMQIRLENGNLTAIRDGREPISLQPDGKDRFKMQKDGYTIRYQFIRDARGNVEKIHSQEGGILTCNRIEENLQAGETEEHDFNHRENFTRADTLRGMLTPLRTCYDVTFYGLHLRVDPAKRTIAGRTELRFRAVRDLDRIQIDLYKNIKINKIIYKGRPLTFTREHNTVYCQFPETLRVGETASLWFFIEGRPVEPNMTTLKGGFLWWYDKDGNPWIESVTQGAGASLWWPCKDHLSDKPDSMAISITVPDDLMNISNGRLLRTVPQPDRTTRYDWYVDYPINNYNVVVNIGKYAGTADTLVRGKDTLPIHYYYLPRNEEKARLIFRHVKPMIRVYEKSFGPYAFPKDGFSIIEAPYGMDHQGAVCIGAINNPVNSDKWDSVDIRNMIFHESAHEWWGNNVTCKDMADFWIHESFASYAEVLAYENIIGQQAATKYLLDPKPNNKEPIIGYYDVNDFHMGDMYPKGARILHTLRSILDNDTAFFGLLNGIQRTFRYQSVTTEDIVGYINKYTGRDFTPFFDQYLRHAALPQLQIQCTTAGDSLTIKYKWKTDVSPFDMPVKASLAKDRMGFIYPSTEWKTMTLPSMNAADFKVDADNFYITVDR